MSTMRFLSIVLICLTPGATAAAAMPRCTGPVRVSCVVDGDTLWFEGEKIRLASIDAPEVAGQCRAERDKAAAATRRLAELLGDGPMAIDRHGYDRFGRTLAVIRVHGADVGAVLVEEGFAHAWAGHRGGWCADSAFNGR